MKNSDLYKKSASKIQPLRTLHPEDLGEVKRMRKRGSVFRKIAIVCAALIFVLALGTVAYATGIGGVNKTIDGFLYGEPVEIDVEFTGNGEYTATFPTGYQTSGGGINADTGEPLSEEELIEHLQNWADVKTTDDGRICLYYRDHEIDLTEEIKENNGLAHAKIKDGLFAVHFTVEWNNDDSYSISQSGGHLF